MKGEGRENENKMTRVELKYCEHCGGLWVRECGAGVYCDKCRSKVDDLPIPKKKPGKLRLPIGPATLVENYEIEPGDEEETDLQAAGGAA